MGRFIEIANEWLIRIATCLLLAWWHVAMPTQWLPASLEILQPAGMI
jgi:hypothetical protein